MTAFEFAEFDEDELLAFTFIKYVIAYSFISVNYTNKIVVCQFIMIYYLYRLYQV